MDFSMDTLCQGTWGKSTMGGEKRTLCRKERLQKRSRAAKIGGKSATCWDGPYGEADSAIARHFRL